jgi:hypothetical protein
MPTKVVLGQTVRGHTSATTARCEHAVHQYVQTIYMTYMLCV